MASTTKPAGSPNRIKTILKNLGPGLITGASDDDPSGIITYTQAGSQFGLRSEERRVGKECW